MPEIEGKSQMDEEQITLLQSGYQAILDLIDKMEQLSQFQDKIDIRSNIDQIWMTFLLSYTAQQSIN